MGYQEPISRLTESPDVVVTGVGVVCPIGIGKEAYWSSLFEQRSGVSRRAILSDANIPYSIAAEVKDFEPKQYVKPRKALKLMCREIQMGVAAAVLAMQDAALEKGDYDPERLGVVLGSELLYCDLREVTEVYRNCMSNSHFDFDRWSDRFRKDMFPLHMLRYLPNMPSCQIGIAHDARGPNNTIVSEEVSSLLAVSEATDIIRRGSADIMIAGGTGSRINLTAMLYRGDVDLSRRINHPESASRPFDMLRDGMVIGEGAGILVLESWQHAKRRNAEILAGVLGHKSVCNARQPTQAIRNSIVGVLGRVIDPGGIGHVNAHGISTTSGDVAEARGIYCALGNVPVTALKSFFGYLGAGGGAVELIASVLSFTKGVVPVTLNYSQPDPECPVNVIHDESIQVGKRLAIALNQSFGGQAVALLLSSP